MDNTDRIVAAIFAAAKCGAKANDFAAYFEAYDLFMAMMREREAQSSGAGGSAASTPDPSVAYASPITIDPQALSRLADSRKYDEAAVLLEGIDLDADLAPDFLYYAGVCLGSVGQHQRAIALLKRAAAGGHGKFWCAYHLGLFEEQIGHIANAPYYFTVSLILDPLRTDICTLLVRVLPDIDFALLHTAQVRTRSIDSAHEALYLGIEKLQLKDLGAAAYYFTLALVFDPRRGEARAQLLALAPDISLDLLPDMAADREAGDIIAPSSSVTSDAIQTIIRQHRDPQAVAIDVGANRGSYTKDLAANFGRVIAFEPNPYVMQILKENIRGANVAFEHSAISDKQGEVTLYIDVRPGQGGVATSVHRLDDLAGLIQEAVVPCTTIDAYCEQHGIAPTLVKIDVEGHEPAVIMGAARTIERVRPVIIMEFWETWFHRGYREMFLWLEPMYELRVLQTGELVRSAYLNTDGKLDRDAGTVDICALPRMLAG
jgi:FkbM family methyltransferase